MKTESPACTNVEISLDTVLSFLKYGGKLKDKHVLHMTPLILTHATYIHIHGYCTVYS